MESEKAIRHGLTLLTASLRQEVDALQVRAYLRGLAAVPADVIMESADRLLQTLAEQPHGKRYFPTVPDWLAACREIVDARRQAAARQARALQEDCPDCRGTGWADAEGPNAVVRCNCLKRAVELVQAAGDALPRLPPSGNEAA
jgi:hypothetical protein